jgi:two-component system, cell cycle sensor histidine kinase and response regulator CckA
MSSISLDPTTGFLPQGDALRWHPVLVAVHTIGDALIAGAFLVIALTLIRIARRSPPKNAIVPALAILCAAFLITSALGHASSVVTIWIPEYGVSGIAKAATAFIGVIAAVTLARSVPALAQLPHRIRQQLENSTIDERVKVRTGELEAANERLRREAALRDQTDEGMRHQNAVLEAQLAELQSLFKSMPVGVAIASDASCRHIRANQAFAQMMGLPQSLSLSSPPFEAPSNVRVTHEGRDLPATELPMQRAIAQNETVRDFEQIITRPDGMTLDVITNAVPIRDANGRPCGCVATFQDFSAQKQAERKRLDFERRLLQSQKLESIGVLAGGIAHDFNNLLTGVLGHTNFARSELSRGSTNVDHLLAQVETSAHRAADLCRQLLAYAGKGQVVVRLIDLNVALQQTVPLLKLAISKKVTLDLQLSSSLPPLRGDPSQINQVLLNLVTNASEAIGPAAGTVTVRTERVNVTPMDMLTIVASPEMEPGSYICIEVHDTGGGISPETIGHIFEPFFTTKFVGRGLGLAAVLGIIHGHHGGIRVSSQTGIGTTFELFFPIVSQGARGTASPFPSASPSNRGVVLVVDDDQVVRDLASAVLSGAGYAVVTAVDGEDAILKLRRDNMQFDAVLLDLTMPKLDGEDTLMALRMISPNLPVVLTSGYDEQAVVQRFVGRGLADFLPKPFVSEALLGVINTVIERARVAAR